ncbi:MAG: 8-amino-7-oxononanoate synthase [Chlamydiia bacterium]|nr:8-amino-7-oxononanoate synthase [Chlamydiia bacterium]
MIKFVVELGSGSTLERPLPAHHQAQEQVANKLKTLLNTEELFLIPTYHAALKAFFSLFSTSNSILLIDRYSAPRFATHLQHTKGQVYFYDHCNLEHLTALLQAYHHPTKQLIILTESLFSINGKIAPLSPLSTLAETHGALLAVDDTLSIGMFGSNGFGLATQHNTIDITIGQFPRDTHTLSAFIATTKELAPYLQKFSTPPIASAILPPASLGGINALSELIPNMQKEREQILQTAQYFRERLTTTNLRIDPSANQTHLVPLITHTKEKTLSLTAILADHLIFASPIHSPLLPKQTCRLLFLPTTTTTRDQITQTLHLLTS